MKKFFFTTLLAVAVFSTGCFGADDTSKQRLESSVTVTTTTSTKGGLTEYGSTAIVSQPGSSKSPSIGKNPSERDSLDRKNPNQKSPSSTSSSQPDDTPEKNPVNTKPADTTDKPIEPVSEPTTPAPKDESIIDIVLGDKQLLMMAGIALISVVLIVILIWLIYDRHKMKVKLNNMNKPSPTKPNTSPAPIMPSVINTAPADEPLILRAGNLQDIGSRKEQQDSFCLSNIHDATAVRNKGLMAVVADGMGGLEGGAQISRLVTDTFLRNYNQQQSFEPTTFLYETANSAELAVENYMAQTGVNGGSTLVAVLIKNSRMDYISVGDSHIYLMRDNTLTLINREHNLGALLKEQAERGEVDPNEPYVNPKRNALTAYIGIGNFRTVDKNEQPIFLQKGDKILLCSDGVYNALGDDALIRLLSSDAVTASEQIHREILFQEIPSQDNFTAIILECVNN